MPSSPKSAPRVTANNTVKLPVRLQQRVRRAMAAEGFTVWAEFCRVALTEKCQRAEERLRSADPAEFRRRYGGPAA